MDRRLKRNILTLGVVTIVIAGVAYFLIKKSARSECVGNGGSDVFACLVTSADREHDSAAPVGDNCYWNKRDPEDKTFVQDANGQALTFKFQVYNFCNDPMRVQMELLQGGNVEFNNCDNVFEDRAAVPPNAPVTKNCTTRAYSQGDLLRRRSFEFRAGSQLRRWDPEVAVRDAN